jgi:hypothetical protein
MCVLTVEWAVVWFALYAVVLVLEEEGEDALVGPAGVLGPVRPQVVVVRVAAVVDHAVQRGGATKTLPLKGDAFLGEIT